MFQQLDEAEREAVAALRAALPAHDGPPPSLADAAARIRSGVREGTWPYPHVAAGAGWAGTVPDDDRRCCVEAAGGLVALRDESGLGPDQESTLMALDLTDWLGAVVGLVRAGAGAPAGPADLVAHLEAAPDAGGPLDPADTELVASAFELVLTAWAAAGVVADGRLTPLGEWLLPRALAWAWGADFDA